MRARSILSARTETLGLQEAADFLRIGYDAMKALVTSGAVPAVALNKKHTVILRDELVAYVRDEGRRQAEERRRKNREAHKRIEPRLRGSARARVIIDKFEAAGERRSAPESSQSVFERLLRLNEVLATMAVSRAHLYRMIKEGSFPKPLKIGARNGWLESEVVTFIDRCKRLRSGPV